MELTQTEFEKFSQHVLDQYPNEACGFVVHGQFIPIANTHEDPAHHFRMDNAAYLKYVGNGLQAVLHSHIKPLEIIAPSDPRAPSKNDMLAQEATALPWGIAVTNGNEVSTILWWGEGATVAPLIGRQFVHGVYDCYSLLRDFYRYERGIIYSDCPREDLWWSNGENLYLDNYAAAGFVEVPLDKVEPDDAVLMAIRSKVPNHAAVYLGDVTVAGQVIKEQLLHHLFGRLSGYDSFAKWRPLMTHALRHKSKIKE